MGGVAGVIDTHTDTDICNKGVGHQHRPQFSGNEWENTNTHSVILANTHISLKHHLHESTRTRRIYTATEMYHKRAAASHGKCIQIGCHLLVVGIVLYFCANVHAIDDASEQQRQAEQQQAPVVSIQQQQQQQQQRQQQQDQIHQHRPIPLVRLPSNTLLKYTAYKDVSILHFRVPTDTRSAYFSFKANEETRSAFRKYNIFYHRAKCLKGFSLYFSVHNIRIEYPRL